ncbi:MAG: hypothetical protein PHW04_05850 [Candidatus Wallbacteria bacterium]|nr:hypothetical protein [Candidatus Wallbacteria bacterium]
MKTAVMIVLMLCLPLLALDQAYQKRIEAEAPFENIRKMKVPDSLDAFRVEIQKELEEGILKSKLGDIEEARRLFDEVKLKCILFHEVLEAYPPWEEMLSFYETVKPKVEEMEKLDFFRFFPVACQLMYENYQEFERNLEKTGQSLKDLHYRVVERHRRPERVREMYYNVEEVIKQYHDKLQRFYEIDTLMKRIRDTLNQYNENRDIARRPPNYRAIRDSLEIITPEFNKLLASARDSIWYVTPAQLWDLRNRLGKVSSSLGNLRSEYIEPVYTNRENEAMAAAMAGDECFRQLYPSQYQDFNGNYQRYLKDKKRSYNPTELGLSIQYLDRALKHRGLYLEFSENRRQELEISEWLSREEKTSSYTERNLRSFYFYAAKTAIAEAAAARQAGNPKKYLKELKIAVQYQEKYGKN